jgi:hypothetical protein
MTAAVGQAILLEASLSFLGLGVQEPVAAWGLMLRGGAQDYAESAPWVAIFPGIAISLAVFGFNLFGTWHRAGTFSTAATASGHGGWSIGGITEQLSKNQYRDAGVGQHLHCLASENDRGNTTSPVWRHCDKVTPLGFCRIDDCPMRMIVHGMHGVAGDANYLRGFGNSPEMLRRQRSGPL